MGFPLRDKITGGYQIIMKSHPYIETTAFTVKENRKYISDKKQITYILTQNGIAIPVHFKFFRVCKICNENGKSLGNILMLCEKISAEKW